MRSSSFSIWISLVTLAGLLILGVFFIRAISGIDAKLSGASSRDSKDTNSAAILEGLNRINSRIDRLNSTLSSHQERIIELETSNPDGSGDLAAQWANLMKSQMNKQQSMVDSKNKFAGDEELNLDATNGMTRERMEAMSQLSTPEGRQRRFEEISARYSDRIYETGISEENIAMAQNYATTEIGRTLRDDGMLIDTVECSDSHCLFEGSIANHKTVASAAMANSDEFDNEDNYFEFLNQVYQMIEEAGMTRSNTAIQRNGDQFYIYARIKGPEGQALRRSISD